MSWENEVEDRFLSKYEELMDGIDGQESVTITIDVDFQVFWDDGLSARVETDFYEREIYDRLERTFDRKQKPYERKIKAFNKRVEALAKRHKIHPTDVYNHLDDLHSPSHY